MIKTRGLYHSGIPVNDIDRAVAFCRDVPGIIRLSRYGVPVV